MNSTGSILNPKACLKLGALMLALTGCADTPPASEVLAGTWEMEKLQCSGSDALTYAQSVILTLTEADGKWTTKDATNCIKVQTIQVRYLSEQRVQFNYPAVPTCTPEACDAACAATTVPDAERFDFVYIRNDEGLTTNLTLTGVETDGGFAQACTDLTYFPPPSLIFLPQ